MQPQSQIFTRYIPIVAIMLSLFLFVQTVNALKANRTIGGSAMPSNVISVSGEGEAFAIPDVATFNMSAEATAGTVADAQKKVTAIIDNALEKVKGYGIDSKDIKTEDYNAYPKYEYSSGICTANICPPQKQILSGYTVSHTVSVKIRKVEDAGTVLGAIGGTGVTNVSGLTFTVDDPTAVERQAREKAISEAKIKAEELAKDLGVKLVRIVNFNENGGGSPMFYKVSNMAMDRAGGEMQSAPTLPVGENKVVSNVTITYEIR